MANMSNLGDGVLQKLFHKTFSKAQQFKEIKVLQMDVSENNGTPKSSILIGFSIINHPFWGTPILETPRCLLLKGLEVLLPGWME